MRTPARTRTLAAVALALAAPALLGGCVLKRSKQALTYVLDPVEAQRAAAPLAAPVAVVGVLKVTVPGWIDRPQVAGRGVSGQIVTDDYAMWGEPVARGIQRVVAENLAALLPDRRVVRIPFPPGPPIDQRLDVTLTEAARQPDGSVLVEARWAAIGPKGEVLVQRRSAHRASPTALGPTGAVAGLSEGLGALSREIADALRALPARPPDAGDRE
jgi:hypothetical protein